MRKILFFLFAFIVVPAVAHDLGVTEVEFTESLGHKYQITVTTQGNLEEVIATPLVPDKCRVHAKKKSLLIKPTFKIQCGGEGFTANDTIVLPWRRDAVLVHAKWLNDKETRTLFMREGETITVQLSELAASSASLPKLAKRYSLLGFEHILTGTDHLLFVLGIMLLVVGAKELLKAITAFTVAHSITLALSVLGLLALPSAPVEASIAFSIVILAYEIIRASQGKPGLTARFPWIVAGGFGLLHGLGFAGSLLNLGVPSTEVPEALLFFNIGVEIGQIVFVCGVLLLVFGGGVLLKKLNSHVVLEKVLRIPTAYAIGSIAMYWALSRTAVIFGG